MNLALSLAAAGGIAAAHRVLASTIDDAELVLATQHAHALAPLPARDVARAGPGGAPEPATPEPMAPHRRLRRRLDPAVLAAGWWASPKSVIAQRPGP